MSETAVRVRDAQESQTTLREGLHPQEHAAVFSERARISSSRAGSTRSG